LNTYAFGGAENPLLYVLFTMQKGFKPGQGWFETAEKLMKIGCFRDFFSSFGISCPVQSDDMGIRQYFNKVKENTVKNKFFTGQICACAQIRRCIKNGGIVWNT